MEAAVTETFNVGGFPETLREIALYLQNQIIAWEQEIEGTEKKLKNLDQPLDPQKIEDPTTRALNERLLNLLRDQGDSDEEIQQKYKDAVREGSLITLPIIFGALREGEKILENLRKKEYEEVITYFEKKIKDTKKLDRKAKAQGFVVTAEMRKRTREHDRRLVMFVELLKQTAK